MYESEHRSRPTSIEGMSQAADRLFGSLMERGRPFTPRADDVIISPFGKCGTTWLQQIFHTLRTRGDTDYDDISRVVPWIDISPGLGLDLDANQKANPRGFKSHNDFDDVAKGGRYIVSFRDPCDAAVSFYRFFEGWFFEPGSIELDDFISRFYLQRGDGTTYWQHLRSWWQQRDNDNVLLLSFEGMKADPAKAIRRVAEFTGIELDDELMAITLDHSSLDFMKANSHQFDDRLMREMSERVCNLPAGSDSAKVREGGVGSNRLQLSEQALAAMAERWRQDVTPALGFADYDAFQKAVEAG